MADNPESVSFDAPDPLTLALRSIIWRRRFAFYAEAVGLDIISEEQSRRLIRLHEQRDKAQDIREAAEYADAVRRGLRQAEREDLG